MTPAVSFSNLSIGIRPVAATGQLAELAKRQQALTQKLAEASKATPPPPSTVAADSIAREISGVQAQIEQVILEAQLSKLNASASASASTGTSTNNPAESGDGNPGEAGAPASPASPATPGTTGTTERGAHGPAPGPDAPNDAADKDSRPGRDPKTGSPNPGPDSATGHGPVASRLSAAAAAQYRGSAAPSNRLDLQV